MKKADLIDNLMFFQQFIGMGKVKKYLKEMEQSGFNSFPEFEDTYTAIRNGKPEKERNATKITCEALAMGFELKRLNEADIDELLFRILEDSLFNSFLYKMTSHGVILDRVEALPELLKSWSVPERKSIINNISKSSAGLDLGFIACSYREYITDNKIESIRVLLLDKELVRSRAKNKEEILVAYPTIIEYDFRRKLIHIRLRDVDGIESEAEAVRTMQGRIERTLKYISSLQPSFEIDTFTSFRKSLYSIEENILAEKRIKAEELLSTFDEPLNSFVTQVVERFSPASDMQTSPKDYISFAVLSIIATTIEASDLGDIIGIKFRSTQKENVKKYAEISISNKDYKCISSDKVYWQNLLVLQEEKAVESLKLAQIFSSGFVESKLEFSLETANVRVHQRIEHPDKKMRQQATDEKYNDLIEYLHPFLIF